ncbi:MAG: hypothetical protein HY696_12155 [Deltaproteobacteria bacterium]|nr:hypothetical protein [Deltaproteobacteria bacterium]
MGTRWGRIAFVVGCLSGLGQAAQAVDFSAHGYFRTRANAFFELDTQRPNNLGNDRFGLVSFNQMRLRVEPVLKLNDHLSLHSQFDILDNIVFGSNNTDELVLNDPIIGTVALPAGAGSLSLVGGQAGVNGSVNVRRAWMDIQTAIGKLRIGRQPSHWGLGIFQNDGNLADGDFGDTADRVLFITQKGFPDGGAVSFGALWDIAYEAQRDPRIGGLGAAIRDNGQDTNQWAGIVFYERPEFDAGLFGGFRRRNGSNGTTTTAVDVTGTTRAAGIDGNTRLYFIDAYAKGRIGNQHTIAAEYTRVGGSISTGVALDAIRFQGLAAPGIIQLPADQTVAVNLAAIEAEGHYDWGGEWKLQAGFAEGDASPLSQRVTQYGFRPDYQLGLLMFHHPVGTSPAIRDGTSGTQLAGGVPITGNFINNAMYGALTYLHRFDIRRVVRAANEFKVGARIISAYAHKDPVNLDFAALLSNANMPSVQSRGRWYGIEGDVLVQATFFDHLKTNFEFGVLLPGSAYDINVNLIDPGGIVATIPPDKADIALGGRLTVSMEF